jgi:hypothetical protein
MYKFKNGEIKCILQGIAQSSVEIEGETYTKVHFTHKQLAEKSGVHFSSISTVLRGEGSGSPGMLVCLYRKGLISKTSFLRVIDNMVEVE